MSPVHSKGPGGGYWYYWLAIGLMIAFVVAVLATDGFGLEY
jgi:hypothetical protein